MMLVDEHMCLLSQNFLNMMTRRLLSYRYATAFLNLFAQKLTMRDLEKIDRAARSFSDYSGYFITLSVAQLSDEKKQSLLHELMVKQFGLSPIFDRLISLVIQDRRVVLLADILRQLSDLYRDISRKATAWLVRSSYTIRTSRPSFLKYSAIVHPT